MPDETGKENMSTPEQQPREGLSSREIKPIAGGSRPMTLEEAKAEVLQREVNAFTGNFVNKHGLLDIIKANPQAGVHRDFTPVSAFNEVMAARKIDSATWIKIGMAIDTSADSEFRVTARSGLLPLILLNKVMEAGRVDTIKEALLEIGLTPGGVAGWLLHDEDTRRCLALLLRLQGVTVADKKSDSRLDDTHDEIIEMERGHLPNKTPFSDYLNIKPNEIGDYLQAIQNTVGCDYGIVRIAYAVFRFLGFPHGNGKFTDDLIEKYMYGRDEKGNLKGDLNPEEVQPFIFKIKDPISTKKEVDPETGKPQELTLAEVLAESGTVGLAVSLSRIPQEQIQREWSDLQLLLDMMDKVSDIRAGKGTAANLEPAQRLSTIRGLTEFGILMAKRKLFQETVERILRLNLISTARGSTEPGFWEKTVHGMRVPLSGFSKKPPVK